MMRTQNLALALAISVGIAPALVLGDDNTGYGTYSLLSITSGTRDTAFGRGTQESISTGTDNTAVGFDALQLDNSSANTAVG